MFPWIFGFSWQPGSLIFLGIFYSVVVVVIATLIVAARRSEKNLQAGRASDISWRDEFAELPAPAKVCRHVFTGEVKDEICTIGFDCRNCELHSTLVLEKAINPAKTDLDANGEPVFGLDMPTDRLYHRGHTWVKKERDGTLTVGLDSFAARIVGKPDLVALPKIGTRLRVNGTGWLIEKHGTKIRVLSPVEGKVIAVGSSEKDFYLRVKPEGEIDLRHLLKGAEIRTWIVHEVERLQAALAAENVGVSLTDGGELVNDLAKNYPKVNWDNVLGEVFLEP